MSGIAKRHTRPAAKGSIKLTRWRRWGLGTGAGIGVLSWAALSLPALDVWRTPGPINTGHETLDCNDCHLPAPGTTRQQLQATAKFVLGMRESPVAVGTIEVDNDACLACHARPDDRHPVFRFLEPRFADARQAIGPEHCVSCHLEHQGYRVAENTTFCEHCHRETKMNADPLDVPHDVLINDERWDTCLGCHDFHGNHDYQTPRLLGEAATPQRVSEYFAGGDSPYPGPVKRRALRGTAP